MCTNQFKIILYQQNTNLHSDVFFYIIRRIKLVKLTCLTLLEQVKILSIEPLIPAVVVNFGALPLIIDQSPCIACTNDEQYND